MALLKVFAENKERSKNRFNIIGKPDQQGNLEYVLQATFTDEERAVTGEVLLELQSRKLLIPTYADMVSPGDWLVITSKGEQALKNETIDELDELLVGLHSEYDLLGMRRGMYEAIASKHTDWQRHAAASGRELVTKVLHTISPDDLVRAQPDFLANNTSQHNLTRKQRIKYFLSKKQGHASESDISIIESANDLIEECYSKLAAITHTDKKEVEHLIKLTEDALMFILER